MQQVSPKKPTDMRNPSINDILDYEIFCVNSNKFMTSKEKSDKVRQLEIQKTHVKGQ